MSNRILTRLADEYVVHFNHKEVQNDVAGSMKDHKDLLEDDQNCIEKTINVDHLDSSNTGNCQCDLCTPGGDSINRIAARLAGYQFKNNEANCGSSCVDCDGEDCQ